MTLLFQILIGSITLGIWIAIAIGAWRTCRPTPNVSKKLYGMDQEYINRLLEKEDK